MMLSGQEIGTLWTITAVFGAIFLVSFLIEPRQMKNSFLFFFFFVAFAGSASLTVGCVYGIALLSVLVFLAPPSPPSSSCSSTPSSSPEGRACI